MKVKAIIAIAVLSGAIMFDAPELTVKQRIAENNVFEEQQIDSKRAGFTAYRIRGIMPSVEWQRALYRELERQGIAWYMPYAVCQVFQESRWNQYSDNGCDKGITQQKGIYWEARASRYGVGGASIWDINAQFRVFACMMSQYLAAANGDIGWALSYYFYGNGYYAEKYVSDVMSHLPYLEGVN